MSDSNELITDINAKLEKFLKDGYHIPGVTILTERPEFMRPSIRIVRIDTTFEKGKSSNDEIYSVGGAKFAFGRLAIQKFADAGRISLKVIDTNIVKGKDVARYSARVSGERFEIDGAPKRLDDVKTYDLCVREEEMRIKYSEKAEKELSKKSPEEKRAYVERNVRKVMVERTKFATEMAITGCQARVVTKMLGLKPAYTLEELRKPFVIVSMTPVIDMMDSDIKRMVTAHMMGIAEALYQAPPPQTYSPDRAALALPDEANVELAGPAEEPSADPETVSLDGPSLSDFEDFPRGTKISVLRRIVRDGEAKAGLSAMKDEELLRLYEGRMAA